MEEDQKEGGMRGVEISDLASGARYMKLHHYADPTKDNEEWLESLRTSLPEREFLREILMDDSVYDGEPVYREYVDTVHCPAKYAKSGIPVDQFADRCEFWGGWDCGQTLQPAFALAADLKIGLTAWILEVVPIEAMPMATFAPLVMSQLRKRLPGHWDRVIHIGDPAGTARSGTDASSSYEEAERHGFTIRSCSEVGIQHRISSVIWNLRREIDLGQGEKIPGVIYDPLYCPTLVEGMRGAYCMRVRSTHASFDANMEILTPAKNQFSHVQDGHAYATIEIRRNRLSLDGPPVVKLR